MANYASAVRRIRRSEKSRQYNKHYISKMKSAIKKLFLIADKEEAEKAFRAAQKMLDKLASKGVIHKNKAANQKSRLAAHVNNL